jgi:hypothetical protein
LDLCVEQDGYDPKKSKINDEKLAEFIRAAISGDLNEVPGLGPAALKLLAAGEGSNKVKTLKERSALLCTQQQVKCLELTASNAADSNYVSRLSSYLQAQESIEL